MSATSMSKLRLITFDATNTLIAMRHSIGHEYRRVALMYTKLTPSEQMESRLTQSFANAYSHMCRKHPNFGARDGLSSQQWWSESTRLAFRGANYSPDQLSDKQLTAVANHLYKEYSTRNCWTVRADCVPLLAHLRHSCPSLAVAVISNFDERLERILVELELRHHFRFVLASRLVGHQKPDPEIFELALREAGVDDPRLALHVGDHYRNDYLAAKKCGWNALLLCDPTSDPNCEPIDDAIHSNHVINSLTQLIGHNIFG